MDQGSAPVFVSYEDGDRKCVEALVSTLTCNGFRCWLRSLNDDVTSEKVDAALRQCHVVLACMTSQFVVSSDRKREISVAVAHRKPMVPLLLSNLSWPPKGDMYLVFGHLSAIDCSDRAIKSEWPPQSQPVSDVIAQIQRHISSNFVVSAVTKLAEGEMMSPQQVSDEQVLESLVDKLVASDDVTNESDADKRFREAATKVVQRKSATCVVL